MSNILIDKFYLCLLFYRSAPDRSRGATRWNTFLNVIVYV